ncbi:Putative 115 kDa protein in type-1 retrotransposable element R1DM [Eumeta japonica]|uniref:115 kDa protein in type-1 retrotransposable element R1DM n=1 Tax=Eumeta variegata TaxID=151549 RepID=A0A4C1ZTH9_EUMVA|nr:Putative 115 kDa protein in type-1 retrotransposable element R1DM [Eumeta japonica]
MRRPRQMGRYSADKGRVLLAAGASAAQNRTHMADGLSVGSEADHASLRFIQSNLQRSKLATAELLVGASRRKIAVALVQEPYVGNTGELKRYSGCRVIQRVAPRAGPVKAAILILDSDVDVEEDQTLIDENVTAAVVTAGNCRIGVVSVYFECDKPIGPYLDRVKWVCSKLGTNKIILGGDVNAWSVWWGSERDDAGEQNSATSSTWRVTCTQRREYPRSKYTGDRLLRSTVDVTACSSALLDRAEEWQVVRGTSSDHNAVTFNVRTGGGPDLNPSGAHESTTQRRLGGRSSNSV